MSDFRLRVFCCVAKNLSFTKASQELFISQPAITKHIQEWHRLLCFHLACFGFEPMQEQSISIFLIL